jgi:hypothetical protein
MPWKKRKEGRKEKAGRTRKRKVMTRLVPILRKEFESLVRPFIFIQRSLIFTFLSHFVAQHVLGFSETNKNVLAFSEFSEKIHKTVSNGRA